MEDYTRITKQIDGKYLIEREINEKVEKKNLINQLNSLKQQAEKIEDELEMINNRIEIIEKALNEDFAEGDTKLSSVRLKGV